MIFNGLFNTNYAGLPHQICLNFSNEIDLQGNFLGAIRLHISNEQGETEIDNLIKEKLNQEYGSSITFEDLTPVRQVPTCFISYSWENEENNDHKDWVRHLGEVLVKNGVNVILDQWHLKAGFDVNHFIEASIRDSSFVLIICTPIYKEKANARSGGCGKETIIITGEFYDSLEDEDKNKFIPILRRGTKKDAIPTYLRSTLYLDFLDDLAFQSSLMELLRTIYNEPRYMPPDLGPKPSF